MVTTGLPVVWGLALLATRWFVPAESAHLGETLWIAELWLLTACAWALFTLLRRSLPPRLDWADAAVWLLVAGQVVSALIVLSTVGQKRAALNMMWEWIGVGVALTLLRHWLRGAAGLQQFARTMAVGTVVLGGFGMWQYCVEFPAYRSQLQELIRFEERLGNPESPLNSAERVRLRELREQLGSLATEQDPVARFKLRQRVLDSSEPLARFALTNTLAGLLAAGLILLLGGISTARAAASPGWRAPLLLLAAGLVAYCLVLTKSRTAWVGLAVGVVGWGVLSRGSRIPGQRIARGVAIAGVVIAALILVAALSGGLDRLVLTEAPKSLGYRLEYWTSSARVILDHFLLGAGPGNFRQHYLQHKLVGSSEEILDPHNQFLDVWACGGLAALAGLIWVWLRFLKRFRAGEDAATGDAEIRTAAQLRRASPDWQLPVGRLPLTGIVALVLLFVMQSIFETVWDLQALAMLAGWLVAALTLKEVEIPRAATLAAGLALGAHLLGAGGIAMPAISVPLMLLLLGTEPGGQRTRLDPAAQSAVGSDRRTQRLCVAALLALLAVAGTCLVTGLWPSYYARLLIAAGESAVYSGHDRAAARGDFEEATRVDRFDPDAWYDLASLDYTVVSGNPSAADEAFNGAVGHLQEAIRRDPHSPKLYWTAGQWQLARFESTGNNAVLDDALASLDRARTLYPNHAGIRSTRAEALAAAGRADAAEEARLALRLDDINRERGHIDLWLPPETRERLQAIADGKHATGNMAAETPP